MPISVKLAWLIILISVSRMTFADPILGFMLLTMLAIARVVYYYSEEKLS